MQCCFVQKSGEMQEPKKALVHGCSRSVYLEGCQSLSLDNEMCNAVRYPLLPVVPPQHAQDLGRNAMRVFHMRKIMLRSQYDLKLSK